MASMMASTQPDQEEQVYKGACLISGSSVYMVQSLVGKGNFGTIVKCTRMDNMKDVAIKMIKKHGSYVEQAKEEVAILSKLKTLDLDKCNIVQWYQDFTYRGHFCLEFEHLEKSLLDFMKDRHFQPLPLMDIRPMVQQLANALHQLKSVGIIHADLKLPNVMLVNHAQQPYILKVIDFGMACTVADVRVGATLQTCSYRAPEIILGLPYTEAIDMWSLGCMAAFMYLGTQLYPGRCEYDVMRYIQDTHGQPRDHMLSFGYKTCRFFHRVYFPNCLWMLKSHEQFQKETGIEPVETRRYKCKSLDALFHIRSINPENVADKVAEMTDMFMFVDMLRGMLQMDPVKRLTPSQVLEHHFTSMSHIASMSLLSNHVKSCLRKTPTTDSAPPATSTRTESQAQSGLRILPTLYQQI